MAPQLSQPNFKALETALFHARFRPISTASGMMLLKAFSLDPGGMQP
jgi:hypothetical protein